MQHYDMYGMPVSLERWSQLFSEPRHVGNDFPVIRGRRYQISTVWLGLDHSFGYGREPVIFETMIFDDGDMSEELYIDRYSSLVQAREGHWRATRWLQRHLGIEPRPLISNGRKP